jgi:Rrf2 family protein
MATQAKPVSVRDLAGFQKIPERFLAKLFTRLKKAGLVTGLEGITGGFSLARPASEIRVMDVLEAVDPGRSLFACAEIRGNCALFDATPPEWATAGPCRIHHFMTEAQAALQDFLRSKTLADLLCEYECKAPKAFGLEATAWFQQRKDGRSTRKTV